MRRKFKSIFAFLTVSFVVRVLFGAALIGSAVFVVPEIGSRLTQEPQTLKQQAPRGENPQQRAELTQPDSLAPEAFSETAKLIAPDGTTSDEMGFSVAVSGNTAIVASSRDD